MEYARAFDNSATLVIVRSERYCRMSQCSAGCPAAAAQSMARFGSQNATFGSLEFKVGSPLNYQIKAMT